MEKTKYFGLHSKLCRDLVEASMPGPPSLFPRKRDGIPVPALQWFMTRYTNLFKMGIASKTLENSYFVMNRQVYMD
jgi:hypothetical protein